ncbi:MAG: hypothetical protein KBT30_00805 [Clostridiales bacterium]|nr:hypothetical protein [Candidatus Apopatousia equi]
MNFLKDMKERDFVEFEQTKVYQELSLLTLLGFNITGYKKGFIYSFLRDNPLSLFNTISAQERSKSYAHGSDIVCGVYMGSSIDQDKMDRVEEKFITLIHDALRSKKSCHEFKNEYEAYKKEFTDIVKKTFKEDFKVDVDVNENAYYFMYCQIMYALYNIDKTIFSLAKEHSEYELEYLFNKSSILTDYLMDSWEENKTIPYYESEIDIIKNNFMENNYKSRLVENSTEQILKSILKKSLSRTNDKALEN